MLSVYVVCIHTTHLLSEWYYFTDCITIEILEQWCMVQQYCIILKCQKNCMQPE